MDNSEQLGFALVLRLAFMGSLFLRVRFRIINSGKQTGLVVGMLGSGGFPPVSRLPFSLPPLLLWLAAGTGACSCFFDDSTMLPHPPPSHSCRFVSPNRLAIVWFFFLLFRPCVVSLKRYRTG